MAGELDIALALVSKAAKAATQEIAYFAKGLTAAGKLAEGAFAAFRAGIAAIQGQVVAFVEKANPGVVQKFTFALQDLQGVIGRALTPLLINLTAIIQKLADYFYALSPASKALVAGLVAAGIGFVIVTVAVIGLNAAFSSLTGGLSAIIGAIGGLVAGVLIASSSTDGLKAAMDALMGPLSEILDVVSEIVTDLISALMPAIEVVFGLIAGGLRLLADAIQSVMPQLLHLVAWFKAITEFVAEVIGIQIAKGAAPGKAPSAVRPAQIGGLSEFLNRQMVTALEKPGGKVDAIQIGQGIAADVKICKDTLIAILGKPAAIQAVGRVAGGFAIAAAGAAANAAGALMNRIAGK